MQEGMRREREEEGVKSASVPWKFVPAEGHRRQGLVQGGLGTTTREWSLQQQEQKGKG